MQKQSEICPTCAVLMEFRKNNTWLKCPICGYMTKVTKRDITPVGVKREIKSSRNRSN